MTAIAPAACAAGPGRPVPWTRFAWVTWRQHRVALTGAAALLGGLAVYLLIEGLAVRHAYAVMASVPSGARSLADQAVGGYYTTAQDMCAILLVVPVLVGVFAGAPVLARELETGTFRFAWTQGAGRLRWVIARLTLLAVAVAAGAGAFSLLFSWYYAPFFARHLDGALAPQVFYLRGVDFAAWALAAFAIGVFAGVLIRRTVAAIGASLAVWAGLYLGTVLFLRKHYQAPLFTSGADPGTLDNWVVGKWYTGPNGAKVSQQAVQHLVQRAPASVQNSQNPNAVTTWLTQHHYTQWFAYQPQSRFWHLQFIEGGWLLALSLALLAATVWLARRRAA